MSKLFTVSFAAAAAAATVMPAAEDAASAATTKEGRGGFFVLNTLAKDTPTQSKIYDDGGRFQFGLSPFEQAGGAHVAAGDVNGDGRPELVYGHAAGPHVRVFDGAGLKLHLKIDPFGSKFQGGVRVAAGDVNGDGFVDIITGAGPGGGPHVKVFDGNGATTHDFDAFEPTFTGGVSVATGDVNGDGRADLIVGTLLGDGSVRTFDGVKGELISQFRPYGEDFNGGINLVAGKFLGQNVLFASKIAAGDGSVRVISLSRAGGTLDFKPFGDSYDGELSLGFIAGAKGDSLVVGQAAGGTVGVFDLANRGAVDGLGFGAASDADLPFDALYLTPFGADYRGGISVAGLGAAAPSIPEPATWAMMIAGFGLAGAAARKTRSSNAQRIRRTSTPT